MKIRTITIGHTKNLGNYENAKMEVTAELEDNDVPEQVVKDIKLFIKHNITKQNNGDTNGSKN